MEEKKVITMQPVASSNISEIGYDYESKVMHIRFTSGKLYRYADVPAETFEAFSTSESKGTYFGKNIRAKFTGQPVIEPAPEDAVTTTN